MKHKQTHLDRPQPEDVIEGLGQWGVRDCVPDEREVHADVIVHDPAHGGVRRVLCVFG